MCYHSFMENGRYSNEFGRDWAAAHWGGGHVAGEHPERCGPCLRRQLSEEHQRVLALRAGLHSLADEMPANSLLRSGLIEEVTLLEAMANRLQRRIDQVNAEIAKAESGR